MFLQTHVSDIVSCMYICHHVKEENSINIKKPVHLGKPLTNTITIMTKKSSSFKSQFYMQEAYMYLNFFYFSIIFIIHCTLSEQKGKR